MTKDGINDRACDKKTTRTSNGTSKIRSFDDCTVSVAIHSSLENAKKDGIYIVDHSWFNCSGSDSSSISSKLLKNPLSWNTALSQI